VNGARKKPIRRNQGSGRRADTELGAGACIAEDSSERGRPWYIDTHMTTGYFSDQQVLQNAVSRQPFGRLGCAEEVADVVLFLCSPESNWITGESMNVSGGFVV